MQLFIKNEKINKLINKKILGSCMTTLIISNKEMGNIMKIVKPLEEFSSLKKGAIGIFKNKAKEQKVESLACFQVH